MTTPSFETEETMDRTEPAHKPPSFDGTDLLRLLRTYWRGITLITLAAAMVVVGVSLLQPKVYSTTASGLVVATGEQDLASALAGDSLARSKATSYESLATSRPVAETVIAVLDLDTTPEALLERISTDVPNNTVEIQITAEAPEPAQAAELANAWVIALAQQVNELESSVDAEDTSSRVTVQPLSNASLPLSPSSPNLQRDLVLGALGGLLLGALYAFVRYRMDRRIRSIEEVRDELGVTVLGVIPQDDRLADGRAIVDVRGSNGHHYDEFVEAVRTLRTNLNFVSVDDRPRKIVITSPTPGTGKSSVAAHLAMSLASTGQNVVLVDSDLRRPVLTKLFGLVPGPGVTDLLVGDADVDEFLQTYDPYPSLRVLGAGSFAPNPAEVLSSRAMQRLLDHLAEDAIVLIDAPPLLPVTDAALVTTSSDGAIIVATARGTTKDEFAESLESLHNVHGKVLGAVLNRVPTAGADASYYGYYGYHGKGYSSPEGGSGKVGSESSEAIGDNEVPQEPVDDLVRAPVQRQNNERATVTDSASARERAPVHGEETVELDAWEASGWRTKPPSTRP
ncbi:polysaccharide biosynthesis tyrosine autokinase [Kocuria rosea]|uniref:polysaccharide biosynthesis tyrosine autokinase n=1 Tax=Kocuria rosea TaxID=1275 RepID=UPI000F712D02|nr:polysaccharide biosynthesis tyrosine autokinase [Kocuria rosea]VEI50363.1 Tyrosine-protein kinase YwqD [Kocuria rosea]